MNHTKEPWEVPHFARKDVQCDCTIIFGGNDDCPLAIGNLNRPTGDWKVDEEIPTLDEAIANAKRIVACVNACAGIRTEALESGLFKHLLNDAYMRTLNPLLPNPQRKQDMTYLGKPVYEEDFEEVENEEE